MTQVHPAPPEAPENACSTLPDETPADHGVPLLRRAWRRFAGHDASARPVEPDHLDEADPVPAVQPAPTAAPAPEPRRVNEWAQRRQAERDARRTTHRPVADRSGWAIAGVVVLGVLVLAIVAVGLSVSLGPLRDTALAVHIDPTAASLWWIGVDGLVVVAIIAAVVLRHDPWARWYALGVVAFFTAASGLLQYMHGRGLTAPDQSPGGDPALPWEVVALVAALVIGTIFCATHLFVYVLRHLFPTALLDQAQQAPRISLEDAPKTPKKIVGDSDTRDGSGDGGRSEQPTDPLDTETEREVRKWFAACAVHLILDAGGRRPSRAAIAGSFGIADRQAGYVIADVEADREERAARQAELDAARTRDEDRAQPVNAINGSPAPTRSGGAP